MKKLLALCLVFSMALALLAGCAKEEQNPAGTISDFESQAHFQPGTSEGEPTSGDTSKAPITGEFVVSEKKYDYKDANLVLLYVENQTKRHYNVTIKGKYLDENGETLKEENQTFEAFPAGWTNNFIFYPKVAFDSFTYELETEEYVNEPLRSDKDGSPLASFIKLTYEKKLFWQRVLSDTEPPVEARMVLFNAEMENSHPTATISAEFHVIVLDAQGEIYVTDYDYVEGGSSGTVAGPVGSEYNGKSRTPIPLMKQEVGADETIPDNVQGVFTAIFAIIDILDDDRFMEQFK